MIDSYNTLVDAVVEIFEDTSTEFANFVPTAVALANNKISIDLDTLAYKQVLNSTVSAGTYTITKPTGYNYTHMLRIGNTTLQRKEEGYVSEYWPTKTATGTPKYFTDTDKNTIRFAPACSATATVEWSYDADVTALSSTNQTNFFTEKHPYLMFAATCMIMGQFIKSPEEEAKHKAVYNELLGSLGVRSKMERKDGQANATNPVSNVKDNVTKGV